MNRVMATASANLAAGSFTPRTSGWYIANNRLVNTGLGITSDSAGNQTAIGGYANTFDAENRVTSSTVGTVTTTYAYDGEGRRVKKSTGGSTLTFVYDAAGKLAVEYGGTPSATGRQYLTADHLGSTRLVTNATGGDPKCSDYLPFGEEIPQGINNRGTCYATFSDPRQKFTGKERDAETGLDYFGARYFSGAQGRFTSPDPFNPILRIPKRSQFNAFLSQPQNWNAYAYTWNNPLRYTDPTGESVYLVMYTTGNSVGDEELKRAAQTKAAEIQKSKAFDPKKDQVIVKGVFSKEDFKTALAGANKAGLTSGGVQQVNLFSHAGAIDGPVFHGGTVSAANPNGAAQFSSSELNSLPGITWSQGASATFYGCRTSNFANQFSSIAGVTAFGTTGPSYFSSRPDRLSSFGATGSLYLIDTLFNRNLAPNFINFTKRMAEFDPE